jgi:bilin biosynthesis protein
MGLFDFTKRGNTEDKNNKTVHELIESLREGNDRKVRREAETALVDLGNAAVYPLIGALNDGDWRVREEAARALGEIGDVRAVSPLINLFKDDKIRVQLWATDALIGLGADIVDPLVSALGDPDRRVRMGSIVALGEIKDMKAIGPLRECLKDKDLGVCEAAQEALDAIQE